MITLNRHVSGTLTKKSSARLQAYGFYIAGVLVAIAAAAVLIAYESVR